MNYTLPDGTVVEFRALTEAEKTEIGKNTTNDGERIREMIRLAVIQPPLEDLLPRLMARPAQAAVLGNLIVAETARALAAEVARRN